MGTYAVRMRETQEIVGLFAASSKSWLWDQVDEILEPSDCEYISVANGGIVFPDAGAPPLRKDPDQHSDASGDDFAWESKHRTKTGDKLWQRIERAKAWVRMDYASEGVGLIARIERQITSEQPNEAA